MKRALDVLASVAGLALLAPLFCAVAFAIWLRDGHTPFYMANRTGRGHSPFPMLKFRTMVVRADASGVDSTARDDRRITRVGRLLRQWKIDELPQLWNVIRGEMSLVGPRPNVERETRLYTDAEKALLRVSPGMTDLASIVFADEGDVLAGSADPDLTYNQLIRPWKSRLGLLYASRRASVRVDMRVLYLTALSFLDRDAALRGVARLVRDLGGDDALQRMARREGTLQPTPPPGATDIVQERTLLLSNP